MRRVSVISVATFIVATIGLAAPAAAQDSAPPVPATPQIEQGQPTPPPPPAAPSTQAPRPGQQSTQAPQAPQPPQPPPARPIDPAQMVNVRVELTITEGGTHGHAGSKTVFLITRGESRGAVRSSMVVEGRPMYLGVDAHPSLLKDGRIELGITFTYSPEAQTQSGDRTPDSSRPADLNESMEVFLVDGKPLLISQSADPKGDRTVQVEVKATVVK